MERLDEEINKQQTEKEYMDDVMMEMELVDEEEKVQYKIGDTFIFLTQADVMKRLEVDSGKINKEISDIEEKKSSVSGRMEELKKDLYSKFGDAINLER